MLGAFGYLLVLALWLTSYVNRGREPGATTLGKSSDLWHAAGGLALITFVLGALSTLRCSGEEVPVLTQLYWALELFVGNQPGVVPTDVCRNWPPLAIEIARVTGLLAVFTGAAAAVLQALHARWSHSLLRRDADAYCFAEIDKESLPLVREASLRTGRSGRIYVIDPNPDDAAVVAAAAMGAVFVRDHSWDEDLIRLAISPSWRTKLLRRPNPMGLRGFSLVSANEESNLRAFRELTTQLDTPTPPEVRELRRREKKEKRGKEDSKDGERTEPAGGWPAQRDHANHSGRVEMPADRIRVRVRIDDIHRAEQWWRHQATDYTFASAKYEVDCVGLFDATARDIVGQIESETQRLVSGSMTPQEADDLPGPVVIVDGESQLALALIKHVVRARSLSEVLVQSERRRSEAGTPIEGGPSVPFRPTILATGHASAELCADARTRWDLTDADYLDSTSKNAWELDVAEIPPGPVLAVLTRQEPNGELHAYRLIRRLWAQRVWVTVPAGVDPVIARSTFRGEMSKTEQPVANRKEGNRIELRCETTRFRAARRLRDALKKTESTESPDHGPADAQEPSNGGGQKPVGPPREHEPGPFDLGRSIRITHQPLQLTPNQFHSIWDQVAYYVGRLYDGPGGGLSAAWEPTPEQMELNRAPIFSVGSLVKETGLVWGPAHRAKYGGICCATGLTSTANNHQPECVFDQVCEMEHERWRQSLLAKGYEPTTTKYDKETRARLKKHHLLWPWDEITPADRLPTVNTVDNVLTVLRIMGFSPWYRVDRIGGYDSARQLTKDSARQLTENGGVKTARGRTEGRPGDWLVKRGDSAWIVSADAFARSYDRQTKQRRPGEHGLLARPCTEAEKIPLRRLVDESVRADPGDWVVREAGVEWPMPAEDFQAGYRILGPDERV